jgi:hypothetical protein
VLTPMTDNTVRLTIFELENKQTKSGNREKISLSNVLVAANLELYAYLSIPMLYLLSVFMLDFNKQALLTFNFY